MAGRLVYCVSAHGYGHASRSAALVHALRRRLPELEIVVRTAVPAALFDGAGARVEAVDGARYGRMLQKDALRVDMEASLAEQLALASVWEETVASETASLDDLEARLVVSDAGAVPLEAAARLGVPGVAVTNFTWDWIFAQYAREDPRWAGPARAHARGLAGARLIRLPLSAPMTGFGSEEDAPLLVRRSTSTREAARRALGLEGERRPVVLHAFGGFEPPVPSGSDDLSGFLFLGFGRKPPGLRAEWRGLPPRPPIPFVDLLLACDAVLGKPGYGTLSESAAHRCPMAFVPRSDFPECRYLMQWAGRHSVGRALALEDFEAGRWREALEAVVGAGPWPPLRDDGAEVIAARLAELL